MKKILLVPGDGIGPEVMRGARLLISLLKKKSAVHFDVDEANWGAERWLKEGIGITDTELKELPQNYSAILFGALGDPRIPDMAHGRAILLALRFKLDLYINLRPIKLLSPRLNIFKEDPSRPINIVIFRENTEDIYLGLGECQYKGTVDEIALDTSRHSFFGVERIIKAAFDYARLHERKRVTLVDKSNAIQFGGSLWQRTFEAVAKKYPEIRRDHLFVDVAAMVMVRDPARFDVIVTSNLFGDILSDLGAGLIGGLGLTASANINPHSLALFEPVHGSAPDIAGQNKANPFAMFLSMAMMMNYLGHGQIAGCIEEAIVDAINKGATTVDLGGSLSCTEVQDQIISRCEESMENLVA
jgi:3-isopropylmalate dehydrogenase